MSYETFLEKTILNLQTPNNIKVGSLVVAINAEYYAGRFKLPRKVIKLSFMAFNNSGWILYTDEDGSLQGHFAENFKKIV